ncbi:MAG: hypothetical protein J7M12_05345 [Candidatus Hydrogenedentes bacterium]|nr:hypothetical protein [Candidatus Hydrogenedentota bacterium]
MGPVVVVPIFIVLVVALIIFGAYKTAQRRKELASWAASKGLTYRQQKDRSFDDRFPKFNVLRQGSGRYAYNIMEGDWLGRRLLAFDYHYETHSTDSKGHRRTHHHHFSAVILSSDLLLKPLFIRSEGFFDKITEFIGFDDIDFESAEFSRKFYVKAEDRRWAYDVIHARTMEFLLSMPRFTIQFDGYNVIASQSSLLKPQEFETAIDVIKGILDRMPDYLVKQLEEERGIS